MQKTLIGIYDFFSKRKAWLFLLFAASLIIPGYFASKVNFEEDISRILPKDKKIDKLNEVFQNSKFIDKLVVTVSLKKQDAEADPDILVAYADSLESAINNKLSGYVKKISGRVDEGMTMELYNTISSHLPVYLDDADYGTIDSLTGAGRIRETLEQNIRTLTSPAGFALKSVISKDPVGISFIGLKKLQQLQYDDNFELYDNYVVTRDLKNLLLFITPEFPPNNTGKNAVMLEKLDSIMEHTGNRFEKVSASYFGATAVSVGNALQLRKDSMLTQGITVLFIIVFLGLYFKKKRAPFIILVPVISGALFSLAAIYFIKGSISVIALGTGSVILGIAVNYSLHVFNHYRHTRNMHQLISDLALPMTVGSFTTIGGFLCLEFVESEMLRDLGLFAAFSLIGASLSSLLFLPHFIGHSENQPVQEEIKAHRFSWIDKAASLRPEYNKYLVMAILLLTVFFAYWSTRVGFESDMQRMNFMSPGLKESEKKLNDLNQFALQSVYLVTEGRTLDEALAGNEQLAGNIRQLQQTGAVKKHSGVSSLIISGALQEARIQKWKQYWSAGKRDSLMAALSREGAALKYNPAAFDRFREILEKDYKPVSREAMESVRRNFLDDYITEKPGKATVVTLLKVEQGKKQSVYDEFESHPEVTVLDKQYLSSRLVQIIRDDFSSIALMTSLLVFFVLLLMYGRIELTLVSFIPMFITWIWILGIMGLAGISFNIINIIVSALIFGLGDDYSLFIMNGLLQEYKTGRKNLSSFKSSILLSAITTIAGLGVLVFAKHPALRSIAVISIVGILSVVIMSQILIPFFFNLLIGNRVKRNLFPWTLASFLKSAFAFSFFLHWSITFTIIGRVFVRLRVKEKGKLLYHRMLSKVAWSLMYIMANVKKKIINPLNEDLSKPAIIICNHQSSLDIVPLVMLSPRILMFTNNRKWNAPFFGPVIRMADYFPAEQVEQHTDRIADRMKQGYSFIIFPEGTRSVDGTIGRFHKGAFYLAEKLGADILPIMIHGTDYTLTKKDALLKDGQVTLSYLPRIKPDDLTFGKGYAERAKKIGAYFRTEFEKLKQEIEQPAYFREKLFYNYLYKGPVLEWYMKVKVRLEKDYRIFNSLVPREGKILDAGCGYGFMSYMLAFTSPGREITAFDYDEEKIITAAHCFSKTDKLEFVHADILSFQFETYDAIILSDMLHYLAPQEQETVIRRAAAHLNPGAVLIIREGNKDREGKHKRTELTEFFSTRLFGFNKTGGKRLSFLSGKKIREMAAELEMGCHETIDSDYTSNTIFVLKKQSKAGNGAI